MSEKKYEGIGLNSVKDNNRFYLYYDNNLLVLHDTTIPFLTILKNGREVPMYGFNILQNSRDEYSLEFFQSGYVLKCDIKERDGVVDFLIYGDGDYSGIIINLYKEKAQKVIGLSEYDGYVATEKKLAFYLENKYIFENVNIRRYDLKIIDRIFITAYQKRIRFLIDTINKPDDMMRMCRVNTRKFKIVPHRKVYELTEDLYSLSDNERDGIIVKNCDELEAVPFLREHYGQVIYVLRPQFRSDSHFLSYFREEDIKKQSNGLYKIDFSKPDASYGFKTVIRKYFDTDLSGIYLDTTGYSQEDMEIMKGVIVSVLPEYTKKILLFDRIASINDFCGYYVIKDKRKVFSKAYMELYKYSGEYYLAAEVKKYEEIKKVPYACDIVIVNNTL